MMTRSQRVIEADLEFYTLQAREYRRGGLPTTFETMQIARLQQDASVH